MEHVVLSDKDSSLPCSNPDDKTRIAAALVSKDIPIVRLQNERWIAINRLPRCSVEIGGAGAPDSVKSYRLFSIFTTDPATIPQPMWVSFEEMGVYMDQYTCRVVMDGCVVQPWIPDGCTESDGLFGVEMWFEKDGEVYPTDKIKTMLQKKQQQFMCAQSELQAA
jgi:hypothetical protein